MIILRTRHFSSFNREMIPQITELLDKDDIEDYEVESKVPKDVISVSVEEGGKVKIFLPKDYEYSQYDIDDFIRTLYPYYRTTTTSEGRIKIMKPSGDMDAQKIAKLIEYIIEENEFCTIVDFSTDNE